MLERYFIPLAPFVLLGLGSIAGLILFASLEKEIRRLRGLVARQPRPDPESGLQLKCKLEDLNARLRDAEERAEIRPAAPPRAASLNLNKRTQAIRLARKGEAASHIAASLSIPRKEVELLLKVYGLNLNGSNEIAT